MEERPAGMNYRIILTGPECTGKSTLACQLAEITGSRCIPEYARGYIAGIGGHYTYADVEHIAKIQLEQFEQADEGTVFFDTWLIITRVWFDVVFGRRPEWIDPAIAGSLDSLYLLCNTDLPWIADEVRENGGPMRERLFERYEQVLKQFGCRYKIVSGSGIHRLECAFNHVKEYISGVRTR